MPRGKPFTKEQWADPAWRERMEKRDAHLKQMRKDTDPWRMKKWGIPQNSSRKEVIPKWRAAHKLADKYLDYMKKTDQAPADMAVKVIDDGELIPHTEMVVPDSDEEKAVIALREAFLLCVGPTAIPEKIKAINTVLAYTKTKPETQTKLRVEKAEDFLDLIAEVNE